MCRGPVCSGPLCSSVPGDPESREDTGLGWVQSQRVVCGGSEGSVACSLRTPGRRDLWEMGLGTQKAGVPTFPSPPVHPPGTLFRSSRTRFYRRQGRQHPCLQGPVFLESRYRDPTLVLSDRQASGGPAVGRGVGVRPPVGGGWVGFFHDSPVKTESQTSPDSGEGVDPVEVLFRGGCLLEVRFGGEKPPCLPSPVSFGEGGGRARLGTTQITGKAQRPTPSPRPVWRCNPGHLPRPPLGSKGGSSPDPRGGSGGIGI